MKKQLFIIRHGETELNKLGIVQGRGVDPSLNDTGRKQARLFYERYKSEGFEIIYTSALKRTHETVASFIEQGIPWEKHSELDEISWGIFEGKPATHEFRALYRKLLIDWKEGKLNEHAPKGESPLEVQERQKKFIRYMIHQPQKKVLICMHGRAIRMFLPTLLGIDLIHMDEFPHHNLTLYKLNFAEGRFTIELFNNMDHLYQ